MSFLHCEVYSICSKEKISGKNRPLIVSRVLESKTSKEVYDSLKPFIGTNEDIIMVFDAGKENLGLARE